MADFLKDLANFNGPQGQAPSLLLANAQPLPKVAPAVVPQANDADAEDADVDQEVNANEAMAGKLASVDTPAPSVGPQLGPLADASQAAASIGQGQQSSANSLQNLLKDPQKLQALLDQYQQQKRTTGMIGAVGDMLANRASAGAMYLGRELPKNDVSGALQSALPNPLQILTAYANLRKTSGAYTPQMLNDLNVKLGASGFKPVNATDADAGNIKPVFDPNSPKALEIEAQKGKTDSMVTRANTGVDAQAAQAAKNIHDNEAISKYREQAMNVDRGLQTMGENPSVTQMSEIAQDFAQALSGKGVSSDFRIKEISTPTVKSQLAKLASYVTSNPDQSAPPEVVKFWKDMGQRLSGAYDRQLAAQAKNIDTTTDTAYGHNPQARSSAHAAANLYISGKWRPQFESEVGGSGGQQASPDVVAYAKKHNITTAQAQAIKDQRTNVQTAGK
jgi:hypothetical protein